MLRGVAEAVQGTDPRVVPPGEDKLLRASHPDHLVVDKVRSHSDQGQVSPLLADDLVRGGGWDQVRKAFQGDRVAVLDHLGYRLAQGRHFGQLPASFARATLCRLFFATAISSSFTMWPMPG